MTIQRPEHVNGQNTDMRHNMDIRNIRFIVPSHENSTIFHRPRRALAAAALWASFFLFGSINPTLASTSANSVLPISVPPVSVLPTGIVPSDKGDSTSLQAADALSVEIRPGSSPQTLTMTLVNTGSSMLHILRDGTPFDDVPGGDNLQIMPAGKHGIHQHAIPYTGPVYQRMPVDSSRFIAIESGQRVSAVIDIAANYTIAADGMYRIQYAGAFEVAPDVSPRAAVNLPDLASTWSPDLLPIDLNLQATPLAIEPRAQQPQFDNCNTVQQNSIIAATVTAESLASESLQSLNTTPVENRSTSPRYTTWFGRYSADNYSTVTSVFNRISSALTNETIAYRCEPDYCVSRSNVIAFVQPFRSNLVNICGLFFNEQRLNDDERAGTVVHELSHLLPYGATNDLSYGSSGTAAVAQNSATDAIDNAESYTLFATNDRPFLPMVNDGTEGGGQVPEVPEDIDTNPGTNATLLEGGSTARGELAANQVSVYRVNNATALELTSVSGDADLYIYNNGSLATEALVCSSVEFSADSTLDTCQLVGDAESFAVVYGFTSTSYTMTAIPRAGNDPEIAPGAISLAVGESGSGVLGERKATIYTAVMPGQIVLISTNGDADLYVYRNSTFSTDSLVCSSELVTPQDECELQGTGRVHIGVLGYDAQNSYEIAIRALGEQPQPSDDDPTPIMTTSSGGGVSGFVAFLMLLGFAVHKYRIVHIRVDNETK